MKAYRNLNTNRVATSLEVVGCMLSSGQWKEIKGLKRVWYTLISVSNPCYGTGGIHGRSEYYTNKKEAMRDCNQFKGDKHTICLVDFEWLD